MYPIDEGYRLLGLAILKQTVDDGSMKPTEQQGPFIREHVYKSPTVRHLLDLFEVPVDLFVKKITQNSRLRTR